MPDSQEQLLPLILAILRSEYVRVVDDPTGSPASSNILAEDLLKYGSFASKVRTVTAGANVTLADTDPIFVEVDPGGADRDVTCPAKGNDNHCFLLRHTGSANTLTVKRSGGATITTLSPGDTRFLIPSAAADYGIISLVQTIIGAEGVGFNYIITPSISGNNLVFELKTLSGGNPSTSDPIQFRVGNQNMTLTTTLSFTKNAGTDWMGLGSALAAKDVDLFVYAIAETGASAGLKFGYSRLPYAETMGDFVNTTTNKKYIAGNWTNFNSTDKVENIGRFRAQLSAGAAFTWSIPTAKVINHPIFETDWLTWQPTYSADASMTYTSVTTDLAQYKISYNTLFFELAAFGTTGGTASAQILATHPWTPATTQFCSFAAHGLDGGNVIVERGQVLSSQLGFSRYDGVNFGLGASRYIRGAGMYRMA